MPSQTNMSWKMLPRSQLGFEHVHRWRLHHLFCHSKVTVLSIIILFMWTNVSMFGWIHGHVYPCRHSLVSDFSAAHIAKVCRPQWSWKELKSHGTPWKQGKCHCLLPITVQQYLQKIPKQQYKCYFFLHSNHLEGECKADFTSIRQCCWQTWAGPCAFHTLLITVHPCDLPLRSTNVLHKPNVHLRDFIWIQVKDLNTSKNAVMEHETAKHS